MKTIKSNVIPFQQILREREQAAAHQSAVMLDTAMANLDEAIDGADKAALDALFVLFEAGDVDVCACTLKRLAAKLLVLADRLKA